jgi:hypothetical protein
VVIADMHRWRRAATWVSPDASNAAITRLCSAAASIVLRRAVTDERLVLLVRANGRYSGSGQAEYS